MKLVNEEETHEGGGDGEELERGRTPRPIIPPETAPGPTVRPIVPPVAPSEPEE